MLGINTLRAASKLSMASSTACRPITSTAILGKVLSSSILRINQQSKFSSKSLLLNSNHTNTLNNTTNTNNKRINIESKKTDTKDLTWEEFLSLRQKRRRYDLGSSFLTAIIGSNIGWAFIANIEIDPTYILWGMDMLSLSVLGIVACGGVGFLFGPALGSVFFKTLHRKALTNYAAKSDEFFEHIKKNRVNPSSQSYANPVPDYYGEKIYSLKGYKQWLRDCRAYRRKSKEFL